MPDWNDEEGNRFTADTVTAGEATKASSHNQLNENACLLRNCKGGILPGDVSGSHDAIPAPKHESGNEFTTWLTLNDDGAAVTLIDVSDYDGIASNYFINTNGCLNRPIYFKIWAKFDPTDGHDKQDWIPGGAHDDELIYGAPLISGGMYFDIAARQYTVSIGTHDFIFSLNLATYDLMMRYNDTADNDDVALYIWVEVCSTFPTS